MVEPVEPLPLLGRNLFAHLAGIFARRVDAIGDGAWWRLSKISLSRHCLEIAVPLQARRLAQRGHKALPARLRAGAAGIEHQAHGHVELAHGVLGPLQIAAHPVEAVGNARKHRRTLPNSVFDCYSRTHVSLLPPPCEEFTTSEPFSRATRVRPPGTMFTLSPKRM